MIVYHRTSREAAIKIEQARTFISREGNDVFVSNVRDGYASGYGEAVVVLDVPESMLTLDDEFQDGEMHYRLDARNIRPEHLKVQGE